MGYESGTGGRGLLLSGKLWKEKLDPPTIPILLSLLFDTK